MTDNQNPARQTKVSAWMHRQDDGSIVATGIPRVAEIWREQGCTVLPLYEHPPQEQANVDDLTRRLLDVLDNEEELSDEVLEAFKALDNAVSAQSPQEQMSGSITDHYAPLNPPSPQTLDELIAQSKVRLAAMTEEERQAMWQAQRESMVRAMTTGCEHGVLDFEDCPQCRNPSPSPQTMGDELLTTIKEFAHWHHLNEQTIANGRTPSDSEIDFEVTAWNRIRTVVESEAKR